MDKNGIYFKNIKSLKDIDNVIEKIGSLDLKTVSVQEIIKVLEPLAIGNALTALFLDKSTDIYRARKFETNKPPKTINDLSYRKAEDVNYLQRCNGEKSTLFYGSFHSQTCIRELRPKVNDYIAISRWEPKEDLLMSNIGFHSNLLNKETDWVNKMHLPELCLPESYIDLNKKIDEYFSNIFYTQINESEAYKYKLSIAISRLRGLDPLDETLLIKEEFIKIGSYKGALDGIIYPSIVDKGFQDNLAIRPFSVNEKLKFLSVEWCIITELKEIDDSETSIALKDLDYANTIDMEGNIEWKGRPGVIRTRFKGDGIKLTQIRKDVWETSYFNGDKVIKL